MKTTILAISLILLSVGAFMMTDVAMYKLRQLDLLGKNYWKENGFKTVVLTILWGLLLVGGVGLLLEQPWAVQELKLAFGLFWVAGLLTWIWELIGAGMLLFSKKPLNFSGMMKHSPYTEEMLEKTMQPLKEITGSQERVVDMLNKTTQEPDEDGQEDWFDPYMQREMKKRIFGRTIGFLVLTGIIYLIWRVLA